MQLCQLAEGGVIFFSSNCLLLLCSTTVNPGYSELIHAWRTREYISKLFYIHGIHYRSLYWATKDDPRSFFYSILPTLRSKGKMLVGFSLSSPIYFQWELCVQCSLSSSVNFNQQHVYMWNQNTSLTTKEAAWFSGEQLPSEANDNCRLSIHLQNKLGFSGITCWWSLSRHYFPALPLALSSLHKKKVYWDIHKCLQQ